MPAAVASSRKRKTTEEIDTSPPKRQTRARAAKATEETSTTAPRAIRITTASARIAAEQKANAAKTAAKSEAKTTKRKTRTDNVEAEEQPKSRTRTKKAEVEKPEIPTRSRSTRTKTNDKLVEDKPTRTRKTKVETTPAEPVVKRSTRTRSATMESEAIAEPKPAVKKIVKRVTFQEDLIQDKENKPVPAIKKKETAKKEPVKATGIKAKPIRKPAVPRAATRGKKAMEAIAEKTPLSPKKVTQVAKSVNSSEDELSAPPKKIFGTPAKPILERPSTPESSISQSPIRAQSSDKDASVLLTSPAKRPPPSPFKDALKQSPVKFPHPIPMPDLLQTSADAINESLKQSPKKFDFTPMRSQGQNIKTKAGDMARAALLGSPARRPASPMKFGSVRMPEKIRPAQPITNTTSIIRHAKDSTLLSATPRRLFGTPAKTKKAVSPVKGPQIVPDETVEFASIPQDPTISEAHLPTPFGFQKYSKAAKFASPGQIFEHDAFDESVQYRTTNDESEDELSLGPLTSSPRKNSGRVRHSESSPLAATPKASLVNLVTPRPQAKNLSMTPLAVQLSGWLATSPARSSDEEGASTEIYTPVAEVIHHRASRRTTMTPAAKTTYFEDQLPEVAVAATPEEPFLNQDLHTDGDVEMVDDDVLVEAPEVAVEASETPSATSVVADAADMDMIHSGDASIIEESFQAVPPTPAAALDEFMTDLVNADRSFKLDSNRILEINAENTAAEETESNAEDSMVADEQTVIITRSAPAEIDEEDIVMETPLETGSSPLELVTRQISNAEEPLAEPFEIYSDENNDPADPDIEAADPVVVHEESYNTPVRVLRTRSKEVRTVARVPLKSASNDSPMQGRSRKARSKSMSAPLAELEISEDLLVPKKDEITMEEAAPAKTPRSVSQPVLKPVNPEEDLIIQAESPFKSVRSGPDAQILRGAVVHVDVHTSEGADASGIFIELLTQMGARCIKQWNWRARSTLGGGEELHANNKPGITHVVFKDGSKRTLQKVREARGLVLCVGVGWVLDCERANRWLDEAAFAVDTSTIPRGGGNRRKSMEPKMLANLDGSIIEARTPAKSTRKSTRLSKGRQSLAATDADETVLLPFTPGQDSILDASDILTPSETAAETSKLLQQTCPPKKTSKALFPLSGNIEDQPDESAREKLAKARRKTMQFAPKVGSPLGLDFAKDI